LDSLAYVFSLEQFGIKFGLDNIRALLARLGNPHQAYRSIHIAGTNGKGSVTAMVDAVLRRAGHRSARYTSPHLVDLSERFVVDGRPVSTDDMRQSAADVRNVIDAMIGDGTLPARPTFFEATTAMAFDLFRKAGVEFAVIEVGLGGRLDSTNVIEPVVTAITSIDLDHQQYLGNTLASIAAEKAGIIKESIPVVVGDVAAEAYDVIARVAQERHAELIPSRQRLRDYGTLHIGLRGEHQIANANVALGVLEALERRGVAVGSDAIRDGLATVTWPGRLDHRTLADGHQIILDAAHNPAGARALASYVRSLGGVRPTLVFGAMRDKDVEGMLVELLPEVARVVVTKPSNQRSTDPQELASRIRKIAPSLEVSVVVSPREAVGAATRSSPLTIVAGSIFLLGDVIHEIGT
jgi:dihydrofolate synthase/folylpolyglutamate synthase